MNSIEDGRQETQEQAHHAPAEVQDSEAHEGAPQACEEEPGHSITQEESRQHHP